MAVNNTGGCRRRRAAQAAVPELPPVPQEPVMHRWPHPAGTEAPSEPAEAELHAIGCALTRQTQLLTEIRALLERLAEQASPGICREKEPFSRYFSKTGNETGRRSVL